MKDKAKLMIKRLIQPSSLAGLSAIMVLFGVPPGTIELSTQAIAGVTGLLAILIDDKSNT